MLKINKSYKLLRMMKCLYMILGFLHVHFDLIFPTKYPVVGLVEKKSQQDPLGTGSYHRVIKKVPPIYKFDKEFVTPKEKFAYF